MFIIAYTCIGNDKLKCTWIVKATHNTIDRCQMLNQHISLFNNRSVSKLQTPFATLTERNFSRKTLPWLGSEISLGGWGPADPRIILRGDSWYSQCTILANSTSGHSCTLILWVLSVTGCYSTTYKNHAYNTSCLSFTLPLVLLESNTMICRRAKTARHQWELESTRKDYGVVAVIHGLTAGENSVESLCMPNKLVLYVMESKIVMAFLY